MLPVVDKPAIQYVVEEAVAAGLDDVLMITGRSKRRARGPLRPQLRARGDARGQGRRRPAAPVRAVDRPGDHPLRPPGRPARPRARGAVRRAARRQRAVRGAARRRPDRRARPAAVAHDRGAASDSAAASIALMEVPPSRSTCTAAPRSSRPTTDDVVRDHRPRREAAPDEAPSNLAIIGRYVLDAGGLRRAARDTARARRRDPAHRRVAVSLAALTTARRGARRRLPRPALRHRRPADYLKAVVRLAVERADLGPRFACLAARFRERSRTPLPRTARTHENRRRAPDGGARDGRSAAAARPAAARRARLRARRGRRRAAGRCPASTTRRWTATRCALPDVASATPDDAGRAAGRRRHRGRQPSARTRCSPDSRCGS